MHLIRSRLPIICHTSQYLSLPTSCPLCHFDSVTQNPVSAVHVYMGVGFTSWGVGNLPAAPTPQKSDFASPSIHQLPQLEVEPQEFLLHIFIFK